MEQAVRIRISILGLSYGISAATVVALALAAAWLPARRATRVLNGAPPLDSGGPAEERHD